ncbi:glycosyltransferase family 71 protein [Suhomyces tanzawaensis NRRL Y-17324]|uniref:Glycosyltransferase family 71 protein n=1 Tax=Suhomyces tanzawaensis NRRL Y-17324 TaxID=984487 RepID=A0A1E4SND2_9ASCO|nr:glycosyltransferase family 71 protein [Suhomyces tanzawaensis NRRL Y-17324]ODV81031.1 glycosyltransferase family 71 protein [Suhomyces tanzawaensis NRRL Y-17324]
MDKLSTTPRSSSRRAWANLTTVVLVLLVLPYLWHRTHNPTTFLPKLHSTASSSNKCSQYFAHLVASDPAIDIAHHELPSAMASLRIFAHCYLDNDQLPLPPGLEAKIIPFLQPQLPHHFTRNGSALLREVPPHALIWRTFRTQMKGKGIVIGCDRNDQLALIIALLNVLDALGNELPIQIVHSVDVPHDEVHAAATNLNQQVWFVNASSVTKQPLSIRTVATIINSFEEMIYMDPASVPLVAPAMLFDTQRYVDTGLLFFKDKKEVPSYLARSYKGLYTSLLPTSEEKAIFGTRQLASIWNKISTTHKNGTHSPQHEVSIFESNFRSVVSDGLFVINRSEHFMGLIIGAALELWGKNHSHQPKELLWLGHVISGGISPASVAKSFNYYYSAIPGTIATNKLSLSVCGSTQFHFSDEDQEVESPTALWASGLLQQAQLDELEGSIIPSDYPFRDATNDNNLSCIFIAKSSNEDTYKYSGVKQAQRRSQRLIKFTPEELAHFRHVMHAWASHEHVM